MKIAFSSENSVLKSFLHSLFLQYCEIQMSLFVFCIGEFLSSLRSNMRLYRSSWFVFCFDAKKKDQWKCQTFIFNISWNIHVQALPQISMSKRKQNSLHMFKRYTINYLCKLEFWRAENVLKIGRFEIQWTVRTWIWWSFSFKLSCLQAWTVVSHTDSPFQTYVWLVWKCCLYRIHRTRWC